MRYNPNIGKKKAGRPRSIPDPSTFDNSSYRSLIRTNTKPTQVIINELISKLNKENALHTVSTETLIFNSSIGSQTNFRDFRSSCASHK